MTLHSPRRRDAIRLFVLLATAWNAGSIQAQTCSAPIVFSSGEEVVGNTCLAADTVPILGGSIVSPQREIVYRFDPAALADGRVRFAAPDFDLLAVVTPACSPDAPILAAIELPAGQSGELVLPVSLSGSHTLIVTAGTTSPADHCGRFVFFDLAPAIVTDVAEFRGLLQPGYDEEDFRVLPRGATPQRVDFGNGSYAYTVTPLGTQAQLAVPTDAQGRPIQALAVTTSSGPGTLRIRFTGAPVDAFGGRFWKTGLPLFAPQRRIGVSVRSGTRVTQYTIVGSNDFRGFLSPRPIDEITISALGSGRPTLDDLIVGRTVP